MCSTQKANEDLTTCISNLIAASCQCSAEAYANNCLLILKDYDLKPNASKIFV